MDDSAQLYTGVAGPATDPPTPTRRPGSIRRTTSHDSLRPDGLPGPIQMDVRGRDLWTDPAGGTTVSAAERLELTVSATDRIVERIAGEPSRPGLAALLGLRTSSGFRKAVDEAIPADPESEHALLRQLLDDLPVALLVSGHAVAAARVLPIGARRSPVQRPDLCAGWVAGGTLLTRIEDPATTSITSHGPLAWPVERADDPAGWHPMGELSPHGMRRRRRLDVWRAGDSVLAECFFRDSHADGDGVERIVHEYTVRAAVDPATMLFTACEAEFGVLPWPECPMAIASAGRLVGTPVQGLRRRVGSTFVGPSTCTHLNDTLRSLEDLGTLLRHVA